MGAADLQSSQPRVRLVLSAFAAGVLIYLTGSLVAPATLPRPAFLPKPTVGAPWQDHQCGGEGNRHTPDWVARDGFWRPIVWSTLAGCI